MKDKYIKEKALLVGMSLEEFIEILLPDASEEYKAQIEETLEGIEDGIDFEDLVDIIKPDASEAEKEEALKTLDRLETEHRKKLRQIAKEILAEDEENQ